MGGPPPRFAEGKEGSRELVGFTFAWLGMPVSECRSTRAECHIGLGGIGERGMEKSRTMSFPEFTPFPFEIQSLVLNV